MVRSFKFFWAAKVPKDPNGPVYVRSKSALGVSCCFGFRLTTIRPGSYFWPKSNTSLRHSSNGENGNLGSCSPHPAHPSHAALPSLPITSEALRGHLPGIHQFLSALEARLLLRQAQRLVKPQREIAKGLSRFLSREEGGGHGGAKGLIEADITTPWAGWGHLDISWIYFNKI